MPSGIDASYVVGQKSSPDALDEVRPAVAAGVDRADRVGAVDLHPAVGDLLEVAADAAERAAGAGAGDEVRDPPVGLLPQLRPGALVVRARVGRVGVLVRLPGAGDLLASRSLTE
jgi:hypothetical protein